MEKKKPTYTEAMKRLEAIVAKIESGETDIDSLSAQLKEAKGLIALCREKLTRVETDVKKILDEDE